MEQFARTQLLIGAKAMDKLFNSRVAIFGIGGVGGYVCEALVRSGIGHFDLIDKDRVSLSNINRQIIATHKTVGRSKVEVMKERMLEINPNVDVRIYESFFLPDNSSDFPFEEYDYVVDAVDTVTAKIELVMKCKELGIPIISSMGAGNKLEASEFKVADIYKTNVCPLAKVMRHELKKRGVKKLKVVYSEEKPIEPVGKIDNDSEEGSKRRSTPGSVAFAPSVAGLIIAGEVVKDIKSFDEDILKGQKSITACDNRKERKVYFVRHGQTIWNVENKICGASDIALTKKGHEQAIATGQKILAEGIKADEILYSPLIRAKDTAMHISEITGIPARQEIRLIEQNFGKYESTARNGYDFKESKKQFANSYDGGESMMRLAQRIYNLLDEIAASDKTYILVAHNGIARSVQSYFNDMTNEEYATFGVDNCAIVEYKWKDNKVGTNMGYSNDKEYKFWGWQSATVPALIDDYKGIKTPIDLYEALSNIWCADTCAPRMRDEWTPENKTLGQCSITAFLVQDIFGGKVYGILRPGGNYHCYNVIGDARFDLTSEQFGDEVLDYENNPEQFREDHFAKEEKRLRYEYLKNQLKKG